MPIEVELPGGSRPLSRPRDAEVAALAARQHGLVAHRQLSQLGFTPSVIQHRLREQRLHRVHRGVYAVGHRLLTIRGHWMAATLACGPAALLSHRDAAALWQILPSARRLIDVTVPTRHGRRPGLLLHHSRDLERAVVDRIPVTSVARTLLDIADVVPLNQLERAIEEAERRRLFDLRDLERMMTPGRRGVRALRAYHDPGFTRSEFERLLARLCRDAGLPPLP